jgi:nucleolin
MAATLFSTSLLPQFLSLSAKPAAAAPSAAAFPSGLPQLHALSAAAVGFRPLEPVRAAATAAVTEELEAEGRSGGDEFSDDLRVFVGNLPFSVDSAQLAGLFEQAGSVEMVEVGVVYAFDNQ